MLPTPLYNAHHGEPLFFSSDIAAVSKEVQCEKHPSLDERVSAYLKNCGEPKKSAKTYPELIAELRRRGLAVLNAERAAALLNECHYYRLMAYRFPFVYADAPDKFVAGTSFSNIWNLYVFDRRLRLATLDAIERVETSLRSRWAHVLGLKYGALAYENAAIHAGEHYQSTLHGIWEAVATSKEPCIAHFRDCADAPQRVPIWAVCEILTQGQLFTMINSLNDMAAKKEIFGGLGLDVKRMSSFLNVLRNVRNICAHHGRLWNKQLFFEMKFPKEPKELCGSLVPQEKLRGKSVDKSVYNVLTILAFLLRRIAPQSQWRARVYDLVSGEEEFVRDGMGFPNDWRERPVWNPSFVKSALLPRERQH